MKINRIIVKNFKSIKSMYLLCSPKLNAFIGENSVGKSNTFDAINWSLGSVYPSFNSTLPQDHFMGQTENEINITLYFDDGNYLQLAEFWRDSKGNIKSGLNLSNNYITGIERQRYCSAYLGVSQPKRVKMHTCRFASLKFNLYFTTFYRAYNKYARCITYIKIVTSNIIL